MERFVFDVAEASPESFGELMTSIDGFFARRASVIYRGVLCTSRFRDLQRRSCLPHRRCVFDRLAVQTADMERFVFDVAETSPESFGELMTSIDGFFARRASVIYRGVPLTLKTPGWYFILLNHYDGSIELAIDATNGYLSAIREGGEGHPWYYFSDCPTEGLGGETRKLACESGYTSLVDENWAGVVAGIPALHDCCYRILRFLQAHRNVVVPENGVELSADERRALARFIFMLCEPPRLRPARNFVSRGMDRWSDEALTSRQKTKVNCWAKMSRFGLHCLGLAVKDKEDEFDAKELAAVSHCGIRSLQDTVGPNGELLLIRCRDYLKEDEEMRRQRA